MKRLLKSGELEVYRSRVSLLLREAETLDSIRSEYEAKLMQIEEELLAIDSTLSEYARRIRRSKLRLMPLKTSSAS